MSENVAAEKNTDCIEHPKSDCNSFDCGRNLLTKKVMKYLINNCICYKEPVGTSQVDKSTGILLLHQSNHLSPMLVPFSF